jgi:hypothetical protein
VRDLLAERRAGFSGFVDRGGERFGIDDACLAKNLTSLACAQN